MFILIPALWSLLRIWGDMMLMIDNLQYTLPLLISALKMSILWSKKKALAPLIDMIAKDWTKVKLKEERNVMLKRAKITRVFAICGGFMILLAFSITVVFPCFGLTLRHVTNLTDPGKPTPIQSYYLYDVTESPQFELTLLMQGIGLGLSGLTYTGVDTFFGLLVLHICGQLENLHIRLTNLGKNLNFKETLKYNIMDHVRLIRNATKSVDNASRLATETKQNLYRYDCRLVAKTEHILLQVINQDGSGLSFMQLIWFVSAGLCVLLHMCLYCLVGEFLSTQSEGISHATYEYVWYTLEPNIAKNLILIMLRAKKPLHITAGKMFPMTMTTFCNLLKTSAGYISVLLANRN
ncbi:PREDICTED: odorant receptor Or2-like [Dinoponera quadriceps]|uniref:Odorant receptor n=1 Tax=Dinoponera quadriceps TaxID=609295 RepID=A0A6P3WQQ2_DINQU|nr:PREDICTED: odorant receptor Or2-like [Dinoponera quadriceps]